MAAHLYYGTDTTYRIQNGVDRWDGGGYLSGSSFGIGPDASKIETTQSYRSDFFHGIWTIESALAKPKSGPVCSGDRIHLRQDPELPNLLSGDDTPDTRPRRYLDTNMYWPSTKSGGSFFGVSIARSNHRDGNSGTWRIWGWDHAKPDQLAAEETPLEIDAPVLLENCYDAGAANGQKNGGWLARHPDGGNEVVSPVSMLGPDNSSIWRFQRQDPMLWFDRVMPAPIRFGTEYKIENNWGDWNGGYLDRSGIGRSDDPFSIRTSHGIRRDGTSGTWKLESVEHKFRASVVCSGDKIRMASIMSRAMTLLTFRPEVLRYLAMDGARGSQPVLEFFPEHVGGGFQTEWIIKGRRPSSSLEYLPDGTPLHEDDMVYFEKTFTHVNGDVTKYWLNTEGRNQSGGYLNVVPTTLHDRDGGATIWRLQAQTPGSFGVDHVFVLMLENRSFDHMLGFSGIKGTDAVRSCPTGINGLSGRESNSYTRNGQQTSVTVATGAPMVMPADPNHEFMNVVKQLGGEGATYTPSGTYPEINNSGFAADFATLGAAADPAILMRSYSKEEVPALYTLATEFAVCDAWFSSMPGPTWPNRFFAIAGSAGNLDDSPSNDLIARWTGGEVTTGLGWTAVAVAALNPLLWPMLFIVAMTPVARRQLKQGGSFKFERGTLFDKLGTDANIYVGNRLNNIVGAVEGVSHTASNFRSFSQFAADLQNKPAKFTFIEPDYGSIPSVYKGNSQHPTDDMRPGDELIATVYNAIRGSQWWDRSMLIVTWDEHGGFYDHVPPPSAPPPGDRQVVSDINTHGFKFDRYGVRVPAVIVSPWIPKGVIDHREYDHASIPSTVEALFNLEPMTTRDRLAKDLTSLLTLSTPRTGDHAPAHIHGALSSPHDHDAVRLSGAAAARALPPKASWEAALAGGGNGPGFLHAAVRGRLAIIAPERLDAAHREVERLRGLPDTPENREILISLLQELESDVPD